MGTRAIQFAVISCLLLGFGRPAATDHPRSGDRPIVLDAVDLSDAISRSRHSVEVIGGDLRSERANVGTLSLPVAGVRLPPGSSVRATLRADASAPISVQITLATSPSDYGKRQTYRIRIDGREVYRASEADPGGGTLRSLFFDYTTRGQLVVVEVVGETSTQGPVTVSSIRTYSKIETPKSKIAIALVSRQNNGYEIDPTEMQALVGMLPRSPYVERQAAMLYNFCSRTAVQHTKEMQRLAGMAMKMGIPLRIAFQVHRDGVPRGIPDGAGGTFTDLPYQQITYDPAGKVDDPGLASLMGDRYDKRFGLSVPNVFGDRPWLTFNHPRLNQFRRIRLTQGINAWRAAREHLAAIGKAQLLPMELSTGDETIYWAKGVDDVKYTVLNAAQRSSLMADFNPFTVASALEDGVMLDPRDGLDYKEKWWLHQNLARQQQRLVRWMFDALPAEPVRLRPQPVFAQDLARRNIYTEPFALPLFPLMDVNFGHPGLELGYVADGRSGGEYWSGAAMLPWLLKERERGRIGLPNLECATAASDDDLVACLRAAYGCGARFATLFDWSKRPDIAVVLKRFANNIETSADFEFPPSEKPPSLPQPVPRREGRESSPPPGKLSRVFTLPAGTFGINRIELFPRPGSSRGTVRVSLRDSERVKLGSFAVTADIGGRDPGVAAPEVILLPALFPLQPGPGRMFVLTIEPLSGALPDLALAGDGQLALRLTADIRLERARSLTIQAWQDAADILDFLARIHTRAPQSRYAAGALTEARSLLTANRPEEAYEAAIRAEQLTLPASFEVPAPGARLDPYWIVLACPGGPVRATIVVYSDRVAAVQVRSETAQRIAVRWGKFETTADLSPNTQAEITLDQGHASPRPRRRRPIRRPFGPPAPTRPVAR